ncbi:TnsA-like heteromeric transposase endonuclease subunit [Kitasatospora sp. NPDC098652]|uniref:TnsA-like heteromeric transposase endonuclease subunit n=1 Tax=Kitasatospora sp. NPDC098652 TaxID=3364095 RepID=UPI00381BEE53
MAVDTGAAIPSDACELDALVVPYAGDAAVRDRLLLDGGRVGRWATSWTLSGDQVVWPVRDLGSVEVLSSQPVRRFTWLPRQLHRPGLEFLVSTGRMHGFESLEERSLLLALDFVGVTEVMPQPFRLDFEHVGGRSAHVPDFLAVMPDGTRWMLDVRPADLIRDEDLVKFAATREAAASAGWRYSVVAGWRRHVLGVVDALSARRRPRSDRLGLQPLLLERAARGPVRFSDLVASTPWPLPARAEALHLLWHRRLGVDLAAPLGDGSPVWLGAAAGGGS